MIDASCASAALGTEPERLLDSPTYDGFPIRPLYTSRDDLTEPALPGRWPFVRGGDALRDVKAGWKVAEVYPADGSAAAEANGAILVGLTEGISALVLRIGEGAGLPGLDIRFLRAEIALAPLLKGEFR